MSNKKRLFQKDIDQYFSGYESATRITPDGKRKRELVYTGKYYRFNLEGNDLRLFRRRSCLLTVGTLALFLVLSFLPVSGCGSAWVSVPSLLAMIPMIYLISGLWNLCTARAPFQERISLLSYPRMQHSCVGVLIFIAVTILSDVAYLIRNHPAAGKIPLDVTYLVGLVLCFAGIMTQYRMLRPLQSICLSEENDEEPEGEEPPSQSEQEAI